jgi:hypothetical protein
MNICKYYVSGNCKNKECRFKHINGVCRNHFYGECTNPNCQYSHIYKYHLKNDNFQEKYQVTKVTKNTESFEPDFTEPNIRVRFNEPIINGNEVSITDNLFYEKNIFEILQQEITHKVYKPWHGDTHFIADDKSEIDWKAISPTFNTIIDRLCEYFSMVPSATRLNYYKTIDDWKPYHHDAAALKPDKAKKQNITVGVSFGVTREISFETTHYDKKQRIRINFPLKDTVVYSFGNEINVNFRHGIPPLSTTLQEINKNDDNNNNNNNNNNDNFVNNGRYSIIIWGYSALLGN